VDKAVSKLIKERIANLIKAMKTRVAPTDIVNPEMGFN
jgi:hypothetical protein